MNFPSKKTPLFILALTAIVCSRVFFLSINDPEGPNLLITAVMSGIIFLASLIAYKSNFTDYKNFLLAVLIQIIVLTGLIFFLNVDSKKSEAQYTKYTSPEIGLEFDYPPGPKGYMLEERMPVDLGTGLIKIIILERSEDKIQPPPVNSEGTPTITISVFENNKKQFSGVWAEENIQYSNINLKRGDTKEVIVGGANAIQYMADGLYASNNAVVAHGDSIYVITGQFIDQNSDLQKDFQPLLESIKFIPKPGQE